MANYLVTYKPLCVNKKGKEVAKKYHLPLFIDLSIRREPDLESEYPSITCVCRDGLFAPRVKEGDVITYITTRSKYLENERVWHLVAVLRAINIFKTHEEAKLFYQAKRLSLPSNCIVPENPPLPVSQTAIPTSRALRVEQEYQRRCGKNGTFVICKTLYKELDNPPKISYDDMIKIFGKVPHTRNPPPIKFDYLKEILEAAAVNPTILKV